MSEKILEFDNDKEVKENYDKHNFLKKKTDPMRIKNDQNNSFENKIILDQKKKIEELRKEIDHKNKLICVLYQ